MGAASDSRTLGFATVVAILFVLGWHFFALELLDNYSITMDSNFTSKYTTYNDSLKNLSGSFGAAGDLLETREFDSAGTEASIFTNVWNSVKLPFLIMKNAVTLVGSAMTILPVPPFVMGTILLMLMILVIWLVVSAVIRKDA